ncbi:hypothetical protein G7Y89_g382 [Cudoniella acicularis]|uniref:Calcineurin-like phosphoesterase domain-containing protein n=1 Tax=Cudoniella acicularis TaxID=354080 RepID=A0A8H4RY78_9HELO|nr:hypothetical protein G7Y89_g382 [Cudoniella acicularis]
MTIESANQTAPVRFLILPDIHNFKYNSDGPFRNPTPKVDVVLHSGGLIQVGGTSEYKRALNLLATIPAELKLVIAGNHDLSLDSNYWKTVEEDERESEKEDHEEVMGIMTGKLAKAAGGTYLEKGMHAFTLQNGATFTIYASHYQPKFGDWAFHYERNEDRFNGPENPATGSTSIATNPIPDSPVLIL